MSLCKAKRKEAKLLYVVDSVFVGAEDVVPVDERGDVSGNVFGEFLKESLRLVHRQWSHRDIYRDLL